jgi:hypothetical protein
LRERGAAHGFEDDGVWPLVRDRLNNFQNLRALIDGVVGSVDDLQANVELACGSFGGFGLFDLIVVVAGGE